MAGKHAADGNGFHLFRFWHALSENTAGADTQTKRRRIDQAASSGSGGLQPVVICSGFYKRSDNVITCMMTTANLGKSWKSCAPFGETDGRSHVVAGAIRGTVCPLSAHVSR